MIRNYINCNNNKINSADAIIIRITFNESLSSSSPRLLPSCIDCNATKICYDCDHNIRTISTIVSLLFLLLSHRINNTNSIIAVLPSRRINNDNIVGIVLLLLSSRRINNTDSIIVLSSNNIASSSASSYVTQVLCHNHTVDILLQVSPSLFFQVGIHIHVIAFLHNILYFVSVSCQFPPVIVALLQQMFDTSLASVHFASLSCNPRLGSRGCIRRLQQGVFATRRIIDYSNIIDIFDEDSSTLVTIGDVNDSSLSGMCITDDTNTSTTDVDRSMMDSNISSMIDNTITSSSSSLQVNDCDVNDIIICLTVTSNVDTSDADATMKSSVASLLCNPHAGSRGCVRRKRLQQIGEAITTRYVRRKRLQQQGEAIATRYFVLLQIACGCGIYYTSNVNFNDCNIFEYYTRDVTETDNRLIVTSNADTSDVDETLYSSVIVTSCITTSSILIGTRNIDKSDVNETTNSSVLFLQETLILVMLTVVQLRVVGLLVRTILIEASSTVHIDVV